MRHDINAWITPGSHALEGSDEKSAADTRYPSARAALARTLSPSCVAAATHDSAIFASAPALTIEERLAAVLHTLATAHDAGSLTLFAESRMALSSKSTDGSRASRRAAPEDSFVVSAASAPIARHAAALTAGALSFASVARGASTSVCLFTRDVPASASDVKPAYALKPAARTSGEG